MALEGVVDGLNIKTDTDSSCGDCKLGKIHKPSHSSNPQGPAEPGVPLGPNERGEIMAKGPQVMKGYHDKPKETQETFLDDWLITGDIGYFNEDNMIFITDRLKELIKVRIYLEFSDEMPLMTW
ncbi:hypothetical protein JTB14_024833 [Gonioctena quinquepunctata]|nr:hypothetical protein JTB14_024833 [Gonioctena quinquepunctata]